MKETFADLVHDWGIADDFKIYWEKWLKIDFYNQDKDFMWYWVLLEIALCVRPEHI